MPDQREPKPLVDNPGTFHLAKSTKTRFVEALVGFWPLIVGGIISGVNDPTYRVTLGFVLLFFALGAFTFLALKRMISVVEVLPDRLRLLSQSKFQTIQLADINWIAVSRSLNSYQIRLKSGNSISLSPKGFTHADQLTAILNRAAVPINSERAKHPFPQKTKTAYAISAVAGAIAATAFILANLQTMDGYLVVFLVLAGVFGLFPTAFWVEYVQRPRLLEDGLWHYKLNPRRITFDQIEQILIVSRDTSESLTITAAGRSVVVSTDSAHLDPPYNFFRDTILQNAVYAKVTGETDPAKLRLCTLTGPLNLLHPQKTAKPKPKKTPMLGRENARVHLRSGALLAKIYVSIPALLIGGAFYTTIRHNREAGTDWSQLIQSALITSAVCEAIVFLLSLVLIKRVEFLRDRVRFVSSLQTFEVQKDEIARVTASTWDSKAQIVKINLTTGRPVYLFPDTFQKPDKLIRRCLNLAQNAQANQVNHPPQKVILHTHAPLFQKSFWWIFGIGAFILVFLQSVIVVPYQVSLALIFLGPVAVFYLFRIRLTPNGLYHPTFVFKTAPYLEITELNISLSPKTGVETLKVTWKNHVAEIRSDLADSYNYPLVRDILLKRCLNATVTGITIPGKLRLCTLPGPLDQLHSKPIDPTTTDQHEESVHA